MLEDIEMRFILTDNDGKLLSCYNELSDAEMDAKDLLEGRDEELKYHIYELMTVQRIGDPYLQNIYELRKSYPESEESSEEESSEETAEE